MARGGGVISSEIAPTLGANSYSPTKSKGGDQEIEFCIAHTLRAEGFDAGEDGTGRGTPIVPELVATLVSNGDAHSGYRDENGFVPVSFGFDLRGREGGAMPEGPHDTANIRASSGGSSRSYVAQAYGITADAIDRSGESASGTAADRCGLGILAEQSPTLRAKRPNVVATQWAVRRLTPTECERLQGVPDGHTRIAWRGKPAGECPDGPRYKALGNSWAVPVVRWIGARIVNAMEGR